MNRPHSTPVLVCGNAGAAGSDLLRRRDIHVYWALSTQEAVAVAKSETPKVLLAREHLAKGVLAGTEHSGRPPTVILLETDGWARKDSYFALGATALVGANSGEKILEAVSEITGLVFSRYPRVPFTTVVEVTVEGDETKLLETVDLSASGVCIKGVPATTVGVRAKVSFEMLDPPLSLSALVIRCFKDRGEPMAGFCFDQITEAERARMVQIVEDERKKRGADGGAVSEAFAPNEDHFADEGTGDLPIVGAHARSEEDRGALKERLLSRATATEPANEGDLSWLDRAVRRLTPPEASLILGEPNAPAWANAAVETRLLLARARAERGAIPPELVQQALTICRTLGDAVAMGDEKGLVQVTATRASLLRELESDKKKLRLGTLETPAHSPPAEPGNSGKAGHGKKGKRKAANA